MVIDVLLTANVLLQFLCPFSSMASEQSFRLEYTLSRDTLMKMGGLSTCDQDFGADGCSHFSIQIRTIRTRQSLNYPPILFTSEVNILSLSICVQTIGRVHVTNSPRGVS